jgi:hypothetical protein
LGVTGAAQPVTAELPAMLPTLMAMILVCWAVIVPVPGMLFVHCSVTVPAVTKVWTVFA